MDPHRAGQYVQQRADVYHEALVDLYALDCVPHRCGLHIVPETKTHRARRADNLSNMSSVCRKLQSGVNPTPLHSCDKCKEGPCAYDHMPKEKPTHSVGVIKVASIAAGTINSEFGEDRAVQMAKLVAIGSALRQLKDQLHLVQTTTPSAQMVKYNAQRSLGHAEESCQKLFRILELLNQIKSNGTSTQSG